MKRAPSIRTAIGESPRATYFGDLTHEQGMAAIYAGLPSVPPVATVAVLEQLDDDPDALCVLVNDVPAKAGKFLCVQPRRAAATLRIATSQPKGAEQSLRYGTGVRSNATTAGFCAVAVDVDHGDLADLSTLADGINLHAGRPLISCVVLSGDARADSHRRAGVKGDRGKGAHVFMPHQLSDDAELWLQTVKLAIVLLRGDTKCTDSARMLRAPGLVGRDSKAARLQTVLMAEVPDEVPTLAELHEALCAFAEMLGLDPDDPEPFAALQWAEDAERLALSPDNKARADQLREDAAHARSVLARPDSADELLRQGDKRRSARAAVSAQGCKHATLPRDTPVTDAKGRTLPFWRWADDAQLQELRGLRAWAPTDAGHTHSTGESRQAPAATLLLQDNGTVCLYCHAEGVAWWPSKPADLALQSVELPTESPWVDHLPLHEARAWLLRADTGTGKTTELARLVGIAKREGWSVAVVTPRISVTAEAARRYGVRCYRDEDGPLTIWPGDGLAVCVNSLSRVVNVLGERVLLVVEESELVAKALCGETMRSEGWATPRNVLRQLQELASGPQSTVVMADALAGEATRALGELLRRGETFREVVKARRRTAPLTMLGSKAELLARLGRDVQAGKRVAVPCTRKDDANAVAELLADSGARVELFTGDSDDAQREKLADVQRWWSAEHCDAVVYTTVAGVGVDYSTDDDAQRFDAVYLIGAAVGDMGWADHEQLMARVRDPREVVTWVQQSEDVPKVPTRAHIERKILAQRQRIMADACAAAGYDVQSPQFTDGKLVHLHAAVEHGARVRSATPRDDLIAYYRARGAPVLLPECAGDNTAEQRHKDAIAKLADQWAEDVANAEPMSVAEYDRAKAIGTNGRDARFERTRLLDRFGEANGELAKADQRGAVTRSVDTLAGVALVLVCNFRAAGRRAIRAARARAGGNGGSDWRSLTGYRVMLGLVRLVLGDDLATALLAPLTGAEANGELVEQDKGWSAGATSNGARHLQGHRLQRQWAEWLAAQPRTVRATARRMGLSPKDVGRDPCRALGLVLGKMGIRRVSSGKVRTYLIDAEAWQRQCRLAQRTMRKLHASEGVQKPRRLREILQADQGVTGRTPRREISIHTGEVCDLEAGHTLLAPSSQRLPSNPHPTSAGVFYGEQISA